MTVEELESLLRHPRFPQQLLPVLLAELRRQRAIEEGTPSGTEQGALGDSLPQPPRIS